MTWGAGKSPKEVWPGAASPPREWACRGRGQGGMAPPGGPVVWGLLWGGLIVTENVLEKVGELAVAVRDVASALGQGP